VRIWSWNIGRREEPWRVIADDPRVDVALVQEALRPPPDFPLAVTPSHGERWETSGAGAPYRTGIAWRSRKVNGRPQALGAINDFSQYVLCVSREGTLVALDIRLHDGPVTLISAYAFWESARSTGEQMWLFADASAHRIVSDIASLLDTEDQHRLIVAGDFNILRGYGDEGSAYWAARYAAVFERLETLGLTFIGPQAPEGGRQADPWPVGQPRDSRNVPTCYSHDESPATASRQIDYVFASRALAHRLRVRARNDPDDWGPSDHCRIEILLDES